MLHKVNVNLIWANGELMCLRKNDLLHLLNINGEIINDNRLFMNGRHSVVNVNTLSTKKGP